MSVPAQGDIIAFKPELDAKRHEQQVPWLVVSVKPYNDASKLVMVCPITSHQGTATSANAAEVLLPANCGASGVVLTFQLQAIDWQAKVHVDGQRSGCDVEGGAAEFEDVFGVVDPFWTKAMAWHPLSRLINPM